MLTHRHFLVEKEKMVCKTIDNLEKWCSLTQKDLILDMTRRTGHLSCTQTCYKETEKLNALTMLCSFFWVSEGNGLLILILSYAQHQGWIKAAFSSLWVYIDISSWCLCITDAVPLISVWKHHAPRWVRGRTATQSKAVLCMKNSPQTGGQEDLLQDKTGNQVRHMI